MTPTELISEKKELQEDVSIYPSFLVERFRRGRENRRIEKKTGKSLPQRFDQLIFFLPLITNIWVISNKDYQERFWVRREAPIKWGDNYGETTMTFEEDAAAVLDTSDYAVEMTPKQRLMLSKLLEIVEEYDGDQSTPLSRYGENDAAIVADPKWDEVRQYAKLVYEEITGEDLDAWEASRKDKSSGE